MIKHLIKIIQVYIDCIKHRNDDEYYIRTGYYENDKYAIRTSYSPYFKNGGKSFYKDHREVFHATLSSPEIITKWNGDKKIKEIVELRELLKSERR